MCAAGRNREAEALELQVLQLAVGLVFAAPLAHLGPESAAFSCRALMRVEKVLENSKKLMKLLEGLKEGSPSRST